MAPVGNFQFFWGGVFSQWYPSVFSIGGIEYSCAEQWMMAQKAILFNDQEALQGIMKAKHPSEQKAIGRQIKGFNLELWTPNAKLIVYRGNYAKYSQDEALKAILLGTDDKELVEASATDVVWGIGLAEPNPDCFDRSKWRGTNWLGEVLMDVRYDLR